MRPALLVLTLVVAGTSLEAQTCVGYLEETSTTAASVNLSNAELSSALAGPIHRYGVAWISLSYSINGSADPMGNVHRLRGSYQRRVVGDGPARYEQMPMHDVFFLTFR